RHTISKRDWSSDVCSSDLYEEGHLNGAINIPLFNIEKEIQNIVKNKNDIIILYCSSGNRSKEAKKILENLEYQEVYNLKGGIDRSEERRVGKECKRQWWAR